MKPTLGEIKLNIDSSKSNLAIATFKGVFRDDRGAWLGGFAGNLGVASVLCAKLNGIKHGLLQVWTRGIRRVWCEIDSQLVVSFINSSSWQKYHSCVVVLADIHALISRGLQVRIIHVWHKANKCANAMARLGGMDSDLFNCLENPPLWMLPLLHDDNLGVVYQSV